MRYGGNYDKLAAFLQRKILLDLLKLLWVGSVRAAMKSRQVALLYAGLGFVMLVIWMGMGQWSGWLLLVIFCVAVVLGIHEHMKHAPMRKKQQFFFDIFYTMGFYASGNIYPEFVAEEEISEYTTMLTFQTLIPINSWFARKEQLEMFLGEKITDIRQNTEDNRMIYVMVGVKPLPDYLEWNDGYICINNVLAVGIDHIGIVGMNLEKYPHAFIAGETGSGKSNILKCLIYQALAKNYEVLLIDFKRGVSFSDFADSVEIYYEYPEVMRVLNDMVAETNSRLDKFRSAKVDNISDYNRVVGGSSECLQRKLIFIDELAELLRTRDKEISNALYDSIETLTRLSRAAGIHLIMGIQRPDSTIVSGQIKNNVPFRVCGRFVDKEPSRIMLSSDAASNLPNIKGRFIVKNDELYEVQSFYFIGDVAGGIASSITDDAAISSSNNDMGDIPIYSTEQGHIEPQSLAVGAVFPFEVDIPTTIEETDTEAVEGRCGQSFEPFAGDTPTDNTATDNPPTDNPPSNYTPTEPDIHFDFSNFGK
ncbi:MAG: FtsK/SpoIIIE domain-containing protein [Defluviitaleaceae bacterium]|nr:FtsK/SpoIIIE domain-containing protein [Defluviitaleaceae bacterium]